jgi:hypothetical protein
MGRGQVFKMYLFGKNRAKGKPELNGSDYGPTPIRNLVYPALRAAQRQQRARPG